MFFIFSSILSRFVVPLKVCLDLGFFLTFFSFKPFLNFLSISFP